MDIFNPQQFAKIPRTQAVPAGIYQVQIVDLKPKVGSKNDDQSVSIAPRLRHVDPQWQVFGMLFDNWLPIRYSRGDAQKEAIQLGKTCKFFDVLKGIGVDASHLLAQLENQTSDVVAAHVETHLKPMVIGHVVGVRVSIDQGSGRNSVNAYLDPEPQAQVSAQAAGAMAPAPPAVAPAPAAAPPVATPAAPAAPAPPGPPAVG